MMACLERCKLRRSIWSRKAFFTIRYSRVHVGCNALSQSMSYILFTSHERMYVDPDNRVHVKYLQMFFYNLDLENRGDCIFDPERR